MSINFKEIKIPKAVSIVIGVILSILILYLGFNLIQNVFTRASDVAPIDVTINEIKENSVKIRYSTSNEAQGVIEYGTSPTALNFFAPESQNTKDHSVELTLLSPNSTYYFQIRIGENKYDNGGVPWTFATKAKEDTQQAIPEPQEEPTPASSIPSPTVASTKATITPVQSIDVSDDSSSQSLGCGETDCQKICNKLLGKGCLTQDLVKNDCIGKVNIKDCSLK